MHLVKYKFICIWKFNSVMNKTMRKTCRPYVHLKITDFLSYCNIYVGSNIAKEISLSFGIIWFTVIESHPDNALEDLRLDKPFPELREHFQSYDLDHMEKKVGGVCDFSFISILKTFFFNLRFLNYKVRKYKTHPVHTSHTGTTLYLIYFN